MRGPIVLFDLDGTVLTPIGGSPGPGRTAIDLAFEEIFGVLAVTEGVRLAGNTDRGIARAALKKLGVKESEQEALIDRALDAYLRHFADVLKTRKYKPIGDVPFAAKSLAEHGARVGLATGNVKQGARMKLESAGLGDVFDMSKGGFGCDAEVRADVLRAAVRRCGGEGEVIVVGDTMHDVTAARAVGAKVVGVATNEAAHAELHEAGAEIIVGECGRDVVEAIKSLTR